MDSVQYWVHFYRLWALRSNLQIIAYIHIKTVHTLLKMTSTASEEIKLPKLDTSGKEWTTWKVWLQLAASSWGLAGYLNGSKAKPMDPAAGKLDGWTVTTTAEVKLVEDYTKDLVTWTKKDMKVWHMIANTLPNSFFVHLVNKNSAREYFTTLCGLFEKRSLVIGAEM